VERGFSFSGLEPNSAGQELSWTELA